MYISVFPVIFETHALLILDDMYIYNSNKKSGFLFFTNGQTISNEQHS